MRDISLLFVGIFALVGVAIYFTSQTEEPLGAETYTKIDWTKPTDDAGWAEDTKKEQLHLKFDEQLDEMKVSHEAKLLAVHTPQYTQATQYPESIEWEVFEEVQEWEEYISADTAGKDAIVQAEKQARIDNYIFEYEKITQSIERIDNEIRLRDEGFVSMQQRLPPTHPDRLVIDGEGSRIRSPLGTAYYIDFDNGDNTNAGTATTTAWQSLDTFTEVARVDGDIAFVRRGTATTTNLTDVTFLSDGSVDDPIIITADYDNLWDDFATSSVTGTATWGEKYIATSASTTDIVIGDWIYFESDCFETFNSVSLNSCAFAYEVETASSTGISTYLPYKGNQYGSGLEIRVMPDAPIWGDPTCASSCSFVPASDHAWRIEGLHLRSSDSGGIIDHSGSRDWVFEDMIFEGDGTSISWIVFSTGAAHMEVRKYRVFDADFAQAGDTNGLIVWEDGLVDLNNTAGISFYNSNTPDLSAFFFMSDIEVRNADISDSLFEQSLSTRVFGRNVNHDGSSPFIHIGLNDFGRTQLSFEDYNGIVGDARQFTNLQPYNITTDDGILMSTTTVTRPSGGDSSIFLSPSSKTSPVNPTYTQLKLFEYPIYTDTSSKTYDVYFHSTSTSNWSADPTADESWIECYYYRNSNNAYRGITKSTGAIDFNGSTDWQALSVTCAPAQEGILYLRGWYGKPKEAPSNYFFMDTTPVIQ